MNRSDIEEMYDGEEFLFLDGYDEAIIGVITGISVQHAIKVCYSVNTIIESLMEEGLSHEDAMEHFSFNIEGCYMGENTPVFMHMDPCESAWLKQRRLLETAISL